MTTQIKQAALAVASQPCVFVPYNDIEIIAEFLYPPIVPIGFRRSSGGFVIAAASEAAVPLTQAPVLCVGVVSFNKDCKEDLKAFRESLISLGARHVPPLAIFEKNDALPLAQYVASALIQSNLSLASYASILMSELSQLRRANEELQNNFFAVEAYLSRQSIQPADLAFRSDALEGAGFSLDFDIDGIIQILPVASTGVTAASIHIIELSHDEGDLLVELNSLEDGRRLAIWRVPSRDLNSGWNTFVLPRALYGIKRTLQLSIRYEGGGSSPTLSLGTPQPIEQFRVRSARTGSPIASNSLALEVWAGLPGFSPPEWSTPWHSITKYDTHTGMVEARVSERHLSKVFILDSADASFDFNAVQYLKSEGEVFVHPPAYGMTTAIIPHGLPPDAVRISAKLAIGNAKSADISFSIGVCKTSNEDRKIPPETSSGMPDLVCSEWKAVKPGAIEEINLFLKEKYHGWADIYLFTRMTEEGNNDFAWARFRAITALIQQDCS
ncbi:DUF6212 domain-containing protein [Methylobacterium oxalidis]|nr:DUF6212 domain-containing protein [Methylobacterium oxalidis]GJE35915.1 hypothetical protein LDDCCGHA_6136 [Methylobacterium oxalidis]